MASQLFTEGVKPGGLTSGTEIRILLCYILGNVNKPVTRQQLEKVLLGEELANYFAMADSIAQLLEQGLVTGDDTGYIVTKQGREVALTLADEVPRTIKETAVRGVIRAQEYDAKVASNKSEIINNETGRLVRCSIGDDTGKLFQMELYMPDELSASMAKDCFIDKGDQVYKLVLASLTGNKSLAKEALAELE